MPVYEYLCNDCGPFTDMRPMAECDDPQDCPHCATQAPRVILTAQRRHRFLHQSKRSDGQVAQRHLRKIHERGIILRRTA